jgi:hypothetical protein
MKRIITLISFVVLFQNCGEKKNTEQVQDSSVESIMSVHDDLMAKMSEMMALQNSLDSLAKVSPDSVNLKSLSHDLQLSDNAMSDWMSGYSLDSVNEKKGDDLKTYLEMQSKKILEVKSVTNSSIEKAKKALGK